MKIVLDTSVIINRKALEFLNKKQEELKDTKESIEIVIPEAVISELEHRANLGLEDAYQGIEFLQFLKKNFNLKIYGERPTYQEIRARAMDEIIMRCAYENQALLLTSDRLLSKICEFRNIENIYLAQEIKYPTVLNLLDDKTLSLHIKGRKILAKKGQIGNFSLVEISEISEENIKEYANDLINYAKFYNYVEIERKGVYVLQIKEFRCVVAMPMFCDSYEITIVRPLVKKKLEDYNVSKNLLKRFETTAEGIFICGPPGAGKSTFAQALAEFYLNKGKIVKTMESPRDLQVPDEISQYAPLEGSMEKTADILLLVRPDYTIYDELRKTSDFEIFKDLRLAGVGMIGVTHSSKAIDAVQRLIGRVELGMIPHVVDTIIFIKDGKIEKTYLLELTVKIPSGMYEHDLARPVIQVKDFETLQTEYEIYSYGNEVVIIPIKTKKKGKTTETGESTYQTGANIKILRTKKHIILQTDINFTGNLKVFADNEFLFEDVCKKGRIKILRNSALGKLLIDAIRSEKKITVE